jgi:hypothetical protein
VDGVLYSKDFQTLVLYPYNHERENYQILEGTKEITFSFAYTEHLKEVIVPESLESLPRNVFANSSIEKLTFSEQSSIKVIPSFAFYNSSILEITIPKSVKSIESSAFKDSNLEHLYFEEDSSLIKIGDYAFSGTKIKNVVLPNANVFIDRYAFSNINLENVYIPIEVIHIHKDAFRYNYNITFFLEHQQILSTINLPTVEATVLFGQNIQNYLQSIED